MCLASQVRLVYSEVELLSEVACVVRELDVDLLLCWDAHASLGFLLARAATLGMQPPLLRQRGRTPDQRGFNEERADEWGERTNSGIKIVGRLILNAWRVARSELAITSFQLEAVAAKVLHERVPAYAHRTLTQWWQPPTQPRVPAEGPSAAVPAFAAAPAAAAPAATRARRQQ